jgi:hypothetical protein
MAKVVSFEEEGFAGSFGESVRETIAKVEPSRMVALAVIGEGLAGEVGLLIGHWFNIYFSASKKLITLAEAWISSA